MSTEAIDEASVPQLGTRQAWGLVGVLLGCATLLSLLASLLPSDSYIQFQQLRKTIQFGSEWVYERIALDPTPIDVALIGNSRIGAAVSAPELEAALTAKLGYPVRVANLSMPQEGRNLHFVVAKRLFAARPKVKVIILSVIEEMPRIGHPAFRDLADTGDVVRAPMFLNLDYGHDISVLPYRQMSLFVQNLWPGPFGVTKTLSPAYAGPKFDSTLSFQTPTGHFVDRDHIVPEPELSATAKTVLARATPRLLPKSAADLEFAIERTYTRQIAEMAQRHHVRVLFLQLPIYTDQRPVAEHGFYEQYGPILTPPNVSTDYTNYSDYGHMNRRGAQAITAWLATQDILPAGQQSDGGRGHASP